VHHFLEIIAAILDLLSLPFSGRRRKGERPSQMEEAQRAVLLITFGMVFVVVGIIWIAG